MERLLAHYPPPQLIGNELQNNQIAQRYTQRQVRRQQRELRHQRREIQRSREEQETE